MAPLTGDGSSGLEVVAASAAQNQRDGAIGRWCPLQLEVLSSSGREAGARDVEGVRLVLGEGEERCAESSDEQGAWEEHIGQQ